MIEIKDNLNNICGGFILELFCLVAACKGTVDGIREAKKEQDGYKFTGIMGSGFEQEFIDSVNENLKQKSK